jgi:two-component system OmpR family sensor kinase
MTLRARLLLALGALLTAALLVSGGLVVGITRASLVAQVDEILRAARSDDFGLPGPGGPPVDPTGRRFALLLFDANGALREALPSGFARASDPVPALPDGGVFELPIRTIVERPAIDGSLAYRVLALRTRTGLPVVLAAPLRDVDAAIGVLVRTLVLVSLAVLAGLLLMGWWLLRRGLRPLEEVTATAERISAGDLAQRVGARDDGSEVGRLGHAFDTMLNQIQAAFESQQEALQARAQSEGRLRRFVADASHELRTPLTSVRGYADLYAAGGLEEDAALELAMRRIGTESRRMGQLVEDMLLLARLDQGRALRSEPVDFSRLVEDAVADARVVEPERPLTAAIEPDLMVLGDEDRLRQVVGNLLANVRVHTAPEVPVEIALTTGDGACRLAVIDHGAGIAPEHAGHIFDRFYRGDTGRSRDRGGSGLGLAIAASVAAAHGGSIDHAPTAGGGATFILILPLAAA